jgi:hypothetical protein
MSPSGNDGEQLLGDGVGVGAGEAEAPEAAEGGAAAGATGAGLSTATAGWGAATTCVVGWALEEADGSTAGLGPLEAPEVGTAVGRDTPASPAGGEDVDGTPVGTSATPPRLEGAAPEATQRKLSPGPPVKNRVTPRETASATRAAQTSGRANGAGRRARRRPVLVRRSRRLSPSGLTAAARVVGTS